MKEMQMFLDLLIVACFGILMIILAGLCYGRSPQSGRAKVTRQKSDSVDGFGGARARDYTYSADPRSSKPGLPVGLKFERKRTDTFKKGEENE